MISSATPEPAPKTTMPSLDCNEAEMAFVTPAFSATDRLSHAIFYANELSDSRLQKIKAANDERWTPAKRSEKSKLIQLVRPWLSSTGPKTPAGKSSSLRNADRGRVALRLARKALRDQSRFLTHLKQFNSLRNSVPPEHYARWERELVNVGNFINLQLMVTMAAHAGVFVTLRNNE
jgi:hypothetical protein